jgi:hypothetical protein
MRKLRRGRGMGATGYVYALDDGPISPSSFAPTSEFQSGTPLAVASSDSAQVVSAAPAPVSANAQVAIADGYTPAVVQPAPLPVPITQAQVMGPRVMNINLKYVLAGIGLLLILKRRKKK